MQTLEPSTAIVQGEQRMLLHGVSWQGFLGILESLGNHRAVRLAYADDVLELMMPLEVHELVKELLNDLVKTWADHYEFDCQSFGSWTMRQEFARGIEPDGCFYIQSVDAVRGKTQLDLALVPPPDLVIEVDITSSSKIRQPIYQALGIPELWRWTGQQLTILKLVNGHYQVDKVSSLVPLTASILTSFVQTGLTNTATQSRKALRQWLVHQGVL